MNIDPGGFENILDGISSLKGGITIYDLTDQSCRYPIGDPVDGGFLFCGEKVKLGKVYCPACHMLTHQRPSLEVWKCEY